LLRRGCRFSEVSTPNRSRMAPREA
jgi:hypothetical protein